MTELESSLAVGGKASTNYQLHGTRQPLLSIETHLNGNKKSGFTSFNFSTQGSGHINANVGITPVTGDPVCSSQRSQMAAEKTQRSFCPKRLPRSSSNVADSRSSDGRIGIMFEHYKDPNEEAILSEGIERLCADLQLCPDEFKVLVLAWKLNAEQMCCFTKSEFVVGLKSMKVDSIKGIQSRLPEIVSEVQRDSELFKDLYRFTFKFGLDAANGQRSLPADVAIVLWRLVFTVCEPPIMNRWLNYLELHPHVKGIPKDTWYMFLNFCDTVGVDLSSYDDTEAWPSLFDDFVEFENDQMNQNISKNETFKKSD